MANKLTLKQEAFCYAYIENGGNASEAYRKAYDARGMKVETIHRNACALLKNNKVATRVAHLQQAAAKRHEVTIDKIVRELSLIGFANMLDYIRTQEDGSAYVDLSKLTREQAAAIGEVTSETYFEGSGDEAKAVKRTKFKMMDKRAALVDLGKHLGMFIERSEVGKPGDFDNMGAHELREHIRRETEALGVGHTAASRSRGTGAARSKAH